MQRKEYLYTRTLLHVNEILVQTSVHYVHTRCFVVASRQGGHGAVATEGWNNEEAGKWRHTEKRTESNM